jgi:hypothetical protein
MSENCKYSFSDLFEAVHNRALDQTEAMKFVLVSQDEKNKIVKELANLAGWKTEDRIGSDGKTYTAFSPTFKSEEHE